MNIEEKNVIQAYLNATESQQSLLRVIFPTIDFEAHKTPQKPSVTERVKTFEDACREIGYDPEIIMDELEAAHIEYPDEVAYQKLRIIAQALNEGWKPDYTRQKEGEIYWATRFALYRTDELYEMSQEEMNEKHIKMLDGYEAEGYYDGFGCVEPASYSDDYASVGHALLMKTFDLAKYFSHQFIEIWMDYLLPRTNNPKQ